MEESNEPYFIENGNRKTLMSCKVQYFIIVVIKILKYNYYSADWWLDLTFYPSPEFSEMRESSISKMITSNWPHGKMLYTL